jgi:hypothetical protein
MNNVPSSSPAPRNRVKFWPFPYHTALADCMLIQCFCDQCRGTLVSQQTKRNHQRKQLKTKTASEQLQRRDERVLASTQNIAGPSSRVSPSQLRLPSDLLSPTFDVSGPPDASDKPGSLVQPSLSDPDFDSFANRIYDGPLGSLSSTVDVNPEYTYDLREGEHDIDSDVQARPEAGSRA